MESATHWTSFVVATGLSERSLFIVGTSVVHSAVFWTLNILFATLQRTSWFSSYKIVRKQEVNRALVRKCIRFLLVSHLIVQPIVLWALYPIFQWSGMDMNAPPPSCTRIFTDILLSFIINDFLFYWTHRTLHHPLFYARFHKQHHQFAASVGIAAEYAGSVETIVSNTIPTFAGPWILGVHPLTLWIYLALRVWETVESHSGYDFPWSVWSLFDWQGGARAHDFHHSVNIGNYGGVCFSFWDTLMGTDRAYRQYLSQLEQKVDDHKD